MANGTPYLLPAAPFNTITAAMKKALRIIASIILKVDKPRIKKPPTIT
jgi:hypothetical protein